VRPLVRVQVPQSPSDWKPASVERIVTYLVPALATKSFEMMLARTPWKLRRRSQ